MCVCVYVVGVVTGVTLAAVCWPADRVAQEPESRGPAGHQETHSRQLMEKSYAADYVSAEGRESAELVGWQK